MAQSLEEVMKNIPNFTVKTINFFPFHGPSDKAVSYGVLNVYPPRGPVLKVIPKDPHSTLIELLG